MNGSAQAPALGIAVNKALAMLWQSDSGRMSCVEGKFYGHWGFGYDNVCVIGMCLCIYSVQ